MLYSKQTGGFYIVGLHVNIPEDAIEVSDEERDQLTLAQITEGKEIGADENGRPIAVDATSPPRIPQQVTRRQGRLALLEAKVGESNMLFAVEALLEAIEDPVERASAMVEYEADTWERDNAFLQSMWAQLGGTEAELDDLFIAASQK